MTIVLDANVALKLVVAQTGSDVAARLADGARALTAPSLFVAELTTTLAKYVRAGVLADPDARLGLALVLGCIGHFADDQQLAERAYELGRDLSHPPYDCFYLALALERNVPMVTADAKFAAKLAPTPYASHVVLLRDWKG